MLENIRHLLLSFLIAFVGMATPAHAQDASNYTVTPVAGVASRTLAEHTADTISIFDQGAKCDGSSHPLSGLYGNLAAAQAVYPFVTTLSSQVDWAALQSAVNLAQSHFGATILVPYGNCQIDNQVTITSNGVQIQGGSRQTVLTFTSQTADDFKIGYQPSQIAIVKLSDLYINHTQKHVSGSGGTSINIKNVSEIEINNVVIDHANNGILLQQVNDVQLDHVNLNDHQGVGLYLYANPSAGERSDGLVFSNFVTNGFFRGQAGLLIDGAVYSVRCFTCVLLQEQNALIVQNSAHSSSAYPQFLFFYGMETDGEGNASVVINSGYRIQFINPELSNTSCTYSAQGCSDGSTLQINNDPFGATREIQLIGGRVGNSRQAAVSIQGGSEISLLGTTFNDASKTGVNTFPTLFINGGDHILIQNSRIGTMQGETKRCTYGLAVSSAVTNLLATGNSFGPCVSGDVTTGGGITTHIINNLRSDGTYS